MESDILQATLVTLQGFPKETGRFWVPLTGAEQGQARRDGCNTGSGAFPPTEMIQLVGGGYLSKRHLSETGGTWDAYCRGLVELTFWI